MNLLNLYEKHGNFDATMSTTPSSKEQLSKNILSLQAQIGVLASKTNTCHYFEKQVETIDGIISSYLLALDYILSIGSDKGFKDLEFEPSEPSQNLLEIFTSLYIDINDFVLYGGLDQFNNLVEDFFSLGESLGFTIDKISTAYINNFTLTSIPPLKWSN